MPITPAKLITLLLLTVLIHQSACVTYKQYALRQKKCNDIIPITNCITNPLSNTTYISVEPVECPLDYYRSQACLAAFSKCIDAPQTENDQIPVHCWNCIVQSPADSDIFKAYQDCLNSSAYHTLGLSLLLLIALAIVLM